MHPKVYIHPNLHFTPKGAFLWDLGKTRDVEEGLVPMLLSCRHSPIQLAGLHLGPRVTTVGGFTGALGGCRLPAGSPVAHESRKTPRQGEAADPS